MPANDQAKQTDDKKSCVYGDGRIDPSQVSHPRFNLDALRAAFTHFPLLDLAGELRNAIYEAILDEHCDPISGGTNPEIRPYLNPPDIVRVSRLVREETLPLFIGKMVWRAQLFDKSDLAKIRSWLFGAVTAEGVHGLRKIELVLSPPEPRPRRSRPMTWMQAAMGTGRRTPEPVHGLLPILIDFTKDETTVFCGTLTPSLEFDDVLPRLLPRIEEIVQELRGPWIEKTLTVDRVATAFARIYYLYYESRMF